MPINNLKAGDYIYCLKRPYTTITWTDWYNNNSDVSYMVWQGRRVAFKIDHVTDETNADTMNAIQALMEPLARITVRENGQLDMVRLRAVPNLEHAILMLRGVLCTWKMIVTHITHHNELLPQLQSMNKGKPLLPYTDLPHEKFVELAADPAVRALLAELDELANGEPELPRELPTFGPNPKVELAFERMDMPVKRPIVGPRTELYPFLPPDKEQK